MKALVYRGPKDIGLESMPDPVIEDDRDAIIKVDKCSICGSDLHIYHGETFSEDTGYCVGHEAVGEVVEIGRSVRQLKVGDKVMISAAVGCRSPIAMGMLVVPMDSPSSASGRPGTKLPSNAPSAMAAKIQTVR